MFSTDMYRTKISIHCTYVFYGYVQNKYKYSLYICFLRIMRCLVQRNSTYRKSLQTRMKMLKFQISWSFVNVTPIFQLVVFITELSISKVKHGKMAANTTVNVLTIILEDMNAKKGLFVRCLLLICINDWLYNMKNFWCETMTWYMTF